jgi:hypothetical protein
VRYYAKIRHRAAEPRAPFREEGPVADLRAGGSVVGLGGAGEHGDLANLTEHNARMARHTRR